MAKTVIGIVSSKAGDKTIVVTLRHAKMHPIYKKRFTRTSKLMAHDDKNEAGIGDRVEIVEVRPLSARKRFNLSKIVAKAGVQFQAEDAVADVVKEVTGEREKPVTEEVPAQEVKTKEAAK